MIHLLFVAHGASKNYFKSKIKVLLKSTRHKYMTSLILKIHNKFMLTQMSFLLEKLDEDLSENTKL
jgi:hypothetical protein